MHEQGHRKGLIARDPEPLGDGDRGQFEGADIARAGRHDRDQRDTASDQGGLGDVELDPDRIRAGQERTDRGAPGDHAEADRPGQRRRPANDRDPLTQALRQLHQHRPAVQDRLDTGGAGKAVRGQRDGQHHDEDHDEAETQQDRRAECPADAQQQHGQRRDADDHRGVHDPLHDDRAKDGRAAQAFALAQGVASDEFTQARREDVVGQIADERVAEDAAVRDPADRRQQDAPARPSRADVDERRQDHHPEEARGGRSKRLADLGQIDRRNEDVEGDDADRDPERAAQQGLRTDRHPLLAPRQSGRRAASFGDRRTRSRWSR